MEKNEKIVNEENLEKVSGGVRMGKDGKPDFRSTDKDGIHVTSATFGPDGTKYKTTDKDGIHVTSATFGPDDDDHIHVTSATF